MHLLPPDPAYREAPFAAPSASYERHADGTLYLRSTLTPDVVERNACAPLRRWAGERPDTVMLAQRDERHHWREITYRDFWLRVSAVGQWLCVNGFTPRDRIALLTGNSIEHAILAYGAMAVGITVVPISPAYSSLAPAEPLLRSVLAQVRPTLAFAQDVECLRRVQQLPEASGIRWMTAEPCEDALSLLGIASGSGDAEFERAFAAVDRDSVAKILFTSGSTGSPKGVINTHGMLCRNSANFAALYHYETMPLVMVEWMPWHHTMGGNLTLGILIHFGGTMYIDDGRPRPGLFEETVRNLSEISVTFLSGVPAYFQLLLDAMERHPALQQTVFSRLPYACYAGASMPPETWVRFQEAATAVVGKKIAFVSALGTTETGPGICACHWYSENIGCVGLPMPGVELKLLPVDGRYELRVRGDNVTPGYLDRPDATAAAFDDEHFYRTGDMVTLIDADDPLRGIAYAGRTSENFKLSAGAWVSTGELRLALLQALSPHARDLVIAGEGREDIRLLLWLDPASELADVSAAGAASSLDVLTRLVDEHNRGHGAVTRRVAAFCVLAEPPSLADGEINDKSYVNQRRVLERRAAIVADLYALRPSDAVVRLDAAR